MWDAVEKLMKSGMTSDVAIDRIYTLYGDLMVSDIISGLAVIGMVTPASHQKLRNSRPLVAPDGTRTPAASLQQAV